MVLWNEVHTGDTLWQCVLNKGNILVSVAFFITQPVNLAPEVHALECCRCANEGNTHLS